VPNENCIAEQERLKNWIMCKSDFDRIALPTFKVLL